jgi:hypothetical protein
MCLAVVLLSVLAGVLSDHDPDDDDAAKAKSN